MAGCAVDILGRGDQSACLAQIEAHDLLIPILCTASLFSAASGELPPDTLFSTVGGALGLAMTAAAVGVLGSGLGDRESGTMVWLGAAQACVAALPAMACVVGKTQSRELALGGFALGVSSVMTWQAMALLMPGEAGLAIWACSCALCGLGASLALGAARIVNAMSWSGCVLSSTLAATLLVLIPGSGAPGRGGSDRGARAGLAGVLAACWGGVGAVTMAGGAAQLLGASARERASADERVVAAQALLLCAVALGPRCLHTAVQAAVCATLALAALWITVDRAHLQLLLSLAAHEALDAAVLLPLGAATLAGILGWSGRDGVARQMFGTAGGMAG
eukprot:3469199-Rhodomonas_salina.1